MALPPSPNDQIRAHAERIMLAVRPTVVALKSFFSAPEIEKCYRIGTGVFVGRKLIITSAHVAGMIGRSRDSERGATLHYCFIGRTVAVTAANKFLKTKVLAVSFSGDVAVLEVEGDGEADLPPPCDVATSAAPKGTPLMVITRHVGCVSGECYLQIKDREMEDDNASRTEWPYSLVDGLGWERYSCQPLTASLKIVPGSPWFNLQGQVVGIASTAVGGETTDSVDGFVVPPLRIRSVLDYAMRKSNMHPFILDSWIDALTFTDSDAEGSYWNVPESTVLSMYAPSS